MRYPIQHSFLLICLYGLVLACNDEIISIKELNQDPGDSNQEVFEVSRMYNEYQLHITEQEGCRLSAKGDFFFLSDTIIQSGEKITLEVEQNPDLQPRQGNIQVLGADNMVIHTINIIQEGKSSQSNANAYAGALQRSYGVGYGYNALDEYASYNSVKDQIISLPALRRYEQSTHSSYIYDDLAPDTETSILEGEDSEELSKSLSIQANLGIDALFFRAHLNFGYSQSDLKSTDFSFCTIMNKYKMASRHLEPYDLAEIVRKDSTILTAGFRRLANKIINDDKGDDLEYNIAMLIETYGTHLIYHAELGGKLEYCSTFERAALNNQTTLSIAAQVSFANMLNFSMGQADQNTYEQISKRYSCNITAKGGDVALTTQIINHIDKQIPKGIIDQWYKSVEMDLNEPKNSNVELIDFKLFPIYDLFPDEARRKIATYLGVIIREDEASFPKPTYTYCSIPINPFQEFPEDTYVLQIINDGQVVAEACREYMGDKEYFCVYPVCYEKTDFSRGVALRIGKTKDEYGHPLRHPEPDSLYYISWQNMSYQQVAIGPRNNRSSLFFDHGTIHIDSNDTISYKSTKIKEKTLWGAGLGGWKYMKLGSYMVTFSKLVNNIQHDDIELGNIPLYWTKLNLDIIKDLVNLQKNYGVLTKWPFFHCDEFIYKYDDTGGKDNHEYCIIVSTLFTTQVGSIRYYEEMAYEWDPNASKRRKHLNWYENKQYPLTRTGYYVFVRNEKEHRHTISHFEE